MVSDPKTCQHKNIHPGRVGCKTVCADCYSVVYVIQSCTKPTERAAEYDALLAQLETPTPETKP